MTQELIITDIEVGSGKTAVKGALITTRYSGRLADGSQFGMNVGGKRQLSVPAHLAYGERQIGERIPANSDLFFDIELLEVLTRDD